MEVYPRASGGTGVSLEAKLSQHGLSPRERGNLNPGGDSARALGSIPARAGEPGSRCHRCAPHGVYPRASGGTPSRGDSTSAWEGLSPRERGNRRFPGGKALTTRSIPARAGEPEPRRRFGPRPWVYPRASGGTHDEGVREHPVVGLSPRERGNPARDPPGQRVPGSIPARAGEPGGCDPYGDHIEVYPRASGGTGLRQI